MTERTTFGLGSRKTLVKTAVGFFIATLFLYLLAAGVGIDRLSDVLADAKLRWLALACLSTLLCLAAWGKAWQVVLGVAGIGVPYHRLVVTYLAATFANYVTPLGQAGGEPFIAYVLSRDTEANYEESLASVVTADLLNLLPFFSFAGVGLSVLLLSAELPAMAETLSYGLLAMALGVPVLAFAGWRYRDPLQRALLGALAPLARRTERISIESVATRIDRLYGAFDRIAADRRALIKAVVFAYVGWVFFALPLYFAGRTLGLPIEPLLVLFIVPASTLAGLVPSPGGLGGVEVVLVVLLLAVTGLPAASAYAIALVYRVASYWFALGVGGVAALWVVGRT